MSTIPPELMSWLKNLRQQVEAEDLNYAELHRSRMPIPFFGDIRTARVLTVGVNPAANEFDELRWDDVSTDMQWAYRLVNYFHQPHFPSHKWFRPWETSLRLLGCSYENRTAAHLDLSPRATMRMTSVPDPLRPTFCSMVNGDLHWLFEVLRFAPNARLLLAAGGVILQEPGEWLQISAYLVKNAENHGAEIARHGTGHLLTIPAECVALPLYSFPAGPADPSRLVNDTFDRRDELLKSFR